MVAGRRVTKGLSGAQEERPTSICRKAQPQLPGDRAERRIVMREWSKRRKGTLHSRANQKTENSDNIGSLRELPIRMQ